MKQFLQYVQKSEVQRAGMEISLTMNGVMMVNSDGPSDITLNDAKIKEVSLLSI